MTSEILHPAIVKLVCFQTAATLRRIWRGFSTPRRFLLSLIALAFTAVWLGNALMTVVLRKPLDPDKFQSGVPLALLAYGIWHLLKVAWRRPKEPFEWSPPERELLCGGPLRRGDLIAYRMVAIGAAAVVKAMCFSFLMVADLRLWAAGLVGSILALLFLDLMRMTLEVTACGLSDRAYAKSRLAVIAVAATALASAVVSAVCHPLPYASGLTLLVRILFALADLRETWVGVVLEAPFRLFGQVITAEQYSLDLATWTLGAVLLIAALVWLVIRLDGHFLAAAARAERHKYQQFDPSGRTALLPRFARVELARIPWRAGAGPLAWRQSISAHRYAGSLMLALAVPGVLACIPLLVPRDADRAVLEVAGGLAFYSFVLLPAALKFDFRRDVDRLTILKALPIRPAAVVVGQIATPVIVASGFQIAVLLIAMLVRPVHPGLLALAVLMLLPLNVLIFALDNLVFLLYPYRLNQEGIEIFVRTTLTFTAKGLFFALALVLAVVWASVSGQIAQSTIWGGWLGGGKVLFALGLWGFVCTTAMGTVYLLVRAYDRFDPSQDTPA
jgi:hypothetical protein